MKKKIKIKIRNERKKNFYINVDFIDISIY